MAPGIQEGIALGIVLLVIGFALYRRWRRRSAGTKCCDAGSPSPDETEKPVHFYRRNQR
jgi:hypothetical protein